MLSAARNALISALRRDHCRCRSASEIFVVKMACRSRSRDAMTVSPKSVFGDGMVAMNLGQCETYRVLSRVLEEGLPTKIGRRSLHFGVQMRGGETRLVFYHR